MAGRPPKVYIPVDRKKVLDQLNADLARYHAASARETAEQKTGQRAKQGA